MEGGEHVLLLDPNIHIYEHNFVHSLGESPRNSTTIHQIFKKEPIVVIYFKIFVMSPRRKAIS